MNWINFKCVESENSGVGSRKCYSQCEYCIKKYGQNIKTKKDSREDKTKWTM